METPLSLAIFNNFRVRFSGIPSAIMAMVRIWNQVIDHVLTLHADIKIHDFKQIL